MISGKIFMSNFNPAVSLMDSLHHKAEINKDLCKYCKNKDSESCNTCKKLYVISMTNERGVMDLYCGEDQEIADSLLNGTFDFGKYLQVTRTPVEEDPDYDDEDDLEYYHFNIPDLKDVDKSLMILFDKYITDEDYQFVSERFSEIAKILDLGYNLDAINLDHQIAIKYCSKIIWLQINSDRMGLDYRIRIGQNGPKITDEMMELEIAPVDKDEALDCLKALVDTIESIRAYIRYPVLENKIRVYLDLPRAMRWNKLAIIKK